MLDENLPSFHFKQSQDNLLVSPVYFSQNGSEPAPEFLFERAHPSTNPAAAGKYAVALKDPFQNDVVYAEVVVEPTWQQPSLSAAEVRAQGQNGGARLQPTPLIPDTFTIQLYDPDQTVVVRYVPSSLTKTDSFEFEMLSQSFKLPTPSQLDRRQTDAPRADFRPRIMFKWKRDSRLSKDMTCYNVGTSLGKHKSKDPDITVALFKMSRETQITVYEPNLQRVEMEDRKGLDIVLVLGAEVIRDLWLAPEKRSDLFNMSAGGPMPNGKRKNSRPSPPPAGASPPGRAPTNGPPLAMSGALGPTLPTMSTANVSASHNSPPSTSAVDAETERLRRMVDEEERRARREAAEREKRDREEAKRLERLLKEEEKDKRRRQAEVDQETERLKKLYGVQGQDIPFARVSPPPQQNGHPPLPTRHQQHRQQQSPPGFAPPPQRPLSVGPGAAGPSRPSGRPSPGSAQVENQSSNPLSMVSGFLQNKLDPKKKPVTKKSSSYW